MSNQYSKEDYIHIADSLIADLLKCKDGISLTTWQLLLRSGYDVEEFDTFDLIKIHYALLRAARANHITLDMSAHRGKTEGLPFNLDFIVRNRKARNTCPYCGSTNTAYIMYGLPDFSEELQEKIDKGEIVLGGCCVGAASPARFCNNCGKEFGTCHFI